jgi:nitrous oxide reductase accessory protein NosL
MPRHRKLAFSLVVLVLSGCSPSDDDTAVKSQQPIALSDQEDEVCGMLVREMSAPRGQVVHRDGSRFFFCSLGDMLVHLGAPSPHGRVEAIFVETMKPDEDPMQSHTGEHPWIHADEAVFVVGIERPGIMGAPVLTYANQSDAEHAMRVHKKSQRLDMAGLLEWWKRNHSG